VGEKNPSNSRCRPGGGSVTPIADPDWQHEKTLLSHCRLRVLVAPFLIHLPGVRLKAARFRAERVVGVVR
jgi:hypothetical protein